MPHFFKKFSLFSLSAVVLLLTGLLVVFVSLCAAQHAFLENLHSRRPRVLAPSAGTGLLIKAAALNVAHKRENVVDLPVGGGDHA